MLLPRLAFKMGNLAFKTAIGIGAVGAGAALVRKVTGQQAPARQAAMVAPVQTYKPI